MRAGPPFFEQAVSATSRPALFLNLSTCLISAASEADTRYVPAPIRCHMEYKCFIHDNTVWDTGLYDARMYTYWDIHALFILTYTFIIRMARIIHTANITVQQGGTATGSHFTQQSRA